MTNPRLAILRATTEITPEGPRIYHFNGEVWDRATKTVVTAVVRYLLTHGLLAAQGMDEYEGKTRVRYTPTRRGWEELNKEERQ